MSIVAKPKLIFDNQDLSAPYTRYTFKLTSSNSSPPITNPNAPEATEEWKLSKRYSEFHALHLSLRRGRSEWESTCRHLGDAFEPVTKMLHRAAGPEFPRKHMRYDTETIIHERRRQLEAFVRTLLAAYTDLEVLLGGAGGRRGAGDECLGKLLLELQRFLQVPPKRKQVEARLTRAVLALGDVELQKQEMCCVCLSDQDLNSGNGDRSMVGLPCEHVFHEDCIIRWLQCSSTCPVCRREVGQAPSRRKSTG